jgi:hypothetical protein
MYRIVVACKYRPLLGVDLLGIEVKKEYFHYKITTQWYLKYENVSKWMSFNTPA